MSRMSKKEKGEGDADNGDEPTDEKKSDDDSQLYYGEEYGEYHDYYIGIGSWGTDKSDAETVSDSNFRVLNFLESGSAISVLEDMLQEILVLKCVIGAPVVSSWDFEYKSLMERFSGSETPKKLFPEVDSTPVLTTPLKLQRDRQLLENVIQKTLKNLLDDGTFEPLFEAAQTLTQIHQDEENLVNEVKYNVKYLKDLSAKVKEKRALDDLEERQRDELLYKLQDEIDDVILKCSIDEQFVDKWEKTRDKQNRWRLKNEEDAYRTKISELHTKSTLEKRANEEMQLYIKGNQLELEEQLEEWMSKYDAEMERRENKILQLKYMRDQSEEEVKRLAHLYEAREIEMKEWVKIREVRKRRSAASLIIQSWWRGFMVRKKLGPYKERKVKPNSGGKKK